MRHDGDIHMNDIRTLRDGTAWLAMHPVAMMLNVMRNKMPTSSMLGVSDERLIFMLC